MIRGIMTSRTTYYPAIGYNMKHNTFHIARYSIHKNSHPFLDEKGDPNYSNPTF
jgi:hypothetical protein